MNKQMLIEMMVNTISNIRRGGHGKLSDLSGLCTGSTALNIAAGPSLDHSIDTIKRLQKDTIVIAAAQVIQVLSRYNITPDFIATADYTSGNKRHFKQSINAPLIACSAVEPSILMQWHSDVYLSSSMVGECAYDSEIFKADLSSGRSQFGGSIAHYMFGIARDIGCDRIILAGHDFGGAGHADGVDGHGGWTGGQTVLDTFKEMYERLIEMHTLISVHNISGLDNIKGCVNSIPDGICKKGYILQSQSVSIPIDPKGDMITIKKILRKIERRKYANAVKDIGRYPTLDIVADMMPGDDKTKCIEMLPWLKKILKTLTE